MAAAVSVHAHTFYTDLQIKLGYTFTNIDILVASLDRTRRSKPEDLIPDYETLETLGDKVLGLVVVDSLIEQFPTWSPHLVTEHSKKFLRNVDDHAKHGSALYRIAKDLNLRHLIRWKPQEAPIEGKRLIGKQKKKLADHAEALIGAILFDCKNIQIAVEITRNLLAPLGLNNSELKSETDHGASTLFSSHDGTVSDVAAPAVSGSGEYTGDEQLFLSACKKGRQDYLVTREAHIKKSVSHKVLVRGVHEAISEGKTNVATWLLKEFEFNAAEFGAFFEMASENPKGGSIVGAIKKQFSPHSKKKQDHEEIAGEPMKLVEIARLGKDHLLDECFAKYFYDSSVIYEALVVAINERKTSAVVSICRHGGLSRPQLQDALDNTECEVVTINRFITKSIQALEAAPAEASGGHGSLVWYQDSGSEHNYTSYDEKIDAADAAEAHYLKYPGVPYFGFTLDDSD